MTKQEVGERSQEDLRIVLMARAVPTLKRQAIAPCPLVDLAQDLGNYWHDQTATRPLSHLAKRYTAAHDSVQAAEDRDTGGAGIKEVIAPS